MILRGNGADEGALRNHLLPANEPGVAIKHARRASLSGGLLTGRRMGDLDAQISYLMTAKFHLAIVRRWPSLEVTYEACAVFKRLARARCDHPKR